MKNEIKNKSGKKKKPDKVILAVVFLLLLFGLMMISSAGVVISKYRFDDSYYFFKHQLFFGIIPGLILLFVIQKIHYKFWQKFSVFLFGIALILLVLVFFPNIGANLQGASRWIDLGPVSFQPTEMMKLALIIYLASWMQGKGEKLKSLHDGFLPFAVIFGLVAILIIMQPDVGTLGAISIIALSMLFVAGVPWKFIASFVASGLILLFILIQLAPYRMDRIIAFMNPEVDPHGIGYQINQAFIAIGSGGFWGLGVGQSRQKFNYLPEPIGDSIFAIVGEELGFFGAGVLIVLFILFAMRGLKIARNAPDKFASLVAVGISSWIIFQAFINIMAIVGLIPLTGITLPFVSYGSTSLIFIMIGVGILLNISKHSKV